MTKHHNSKQHGKDRACSSCASTSLSIKKESGQQFKEELKQKLPLWDMLRVLGQALWSLRKSQKVHGDLQGCFIWSKSTFTSHLTLFAVFATVGNLWQSVLIYVLRVYDTINFYPAVVFLPQFLAVAFFLLLLASGKPWTEYFFMFSFLSPFVSCQIVLCL